MEQSYFSYYQNNIFLDLHQYFDCIHNTMHNLVNFKHQKIQYDILFFYICHLQKHLLIME